MTLLVTGATGSIGSRLVERLAERGPVRALVRRSAEAPAADRLAAILAGPAREAIRSGRIEVVEGDLAEADLDSLAPGLEAIVHLAARTDFSDDSIEDYRPVNVEGARRAGEIAARAGCPLHHVSTAHVSGDHGGVFGEDDLDLGQGHLNAYERSKWEAEVLLRRLAAERGFPLAIYRPGIVLAEAPRRGLGVGPGPLVHLRILSGLEGRRGGRVRTIRYEADPEGRLDLVPLEFVTGVLAEAVRRPPARGVPAYHLTAGRSFTVGEVERALNATLAGIEVRLVPPGSLADPDPFERVLARRVSIYRPYLSLRTTYSRARLVAEFGGEDGADPAWLGRVFDEHARVWRAGSLDPPGHDPRVEAYFAGFLTAKLGLALVPGLSRLRADFTVTVGSAGTHRLAIDEGRLRAVQRVDSPSSHYDYELDAAGFLEVVAGRTRPASLFLDRRIRIRGDLYSALSTATALEDFFRQFPYPLEGP